MRVKNKQLDWKVLNWDFNTKQLKTYNIFGQGYIEELYTNYKKKKINTLQDLKEFSINYFRYHFWCRAEYEIMVGDLFTNLDDLVKIDIFYQIEMNIDRIIEYVNKELDIGL